jgi:hypothetical protein
MSPDPTAGIPVQILELSGWRGLDTQSPITDTDPHFLADCQNIDFDDEGVIAKRRGMQKVNVTLSGSGGCNLIYDFYSQQGFISPSDGQRVIIIKGSTLNVIQSFSLAGMTTSATFAATDALHYGTSANNGVCFISNENGGAAPKLLCYNGSQWVYRSAELTAPASAPSLVAGSTGSFTGTFTAIYTYMDIFGNESNPSPEPTVGVSLTGKNLNVGVTASADTTVDTIAVYVLAPSLSTYRLAGTTSNTSGTYSTSLTEATLGSSPEVVFDNFSCPYGKYVRIFNDMLIVGGDPTLPDLIYCSNWLFPRQFNLGTDFDRVGSCDGQAVKGFGSLLTDMVVAKQNARFLASGPDNTTFHTRQYDQDYGILGQPSMVSISKKNIFFSDDGVYLDPGNVPQEISRRIRPTLRQLNPANLSVIPPKQFTAVYKYYKKILFAVREATGAGPNDTLLVYNYELDTWTKYKGVQVQYIAPVHVSQNYELLYGGDSSSNVFLFSPPNGGSPNSDNHTGSTVSISAYAETPWIHLPRAKGMEDWERRKSESAWLQIYAGGEPATGNSTITITTNVYTDFSATIRGTYSTTHNATSWPTASCSPKLIKGFGSLGQFDWIKFRFTNNLMDEHFRITKLAIGFRAKPAVEY